MAKCSPFVEIFEHKLRFGDVVKGNVVVEVDEDVTTNGVEVDLLWHTHGRGDRDEAVHDSLRLPAAAWRAGQPVRIPFQLKLPASGPATVRGTLVNVDWYVRARVDLPWAIDPKAESDVLVENPEGARPFRQGAGAPGELQANAASMTTMKPGCAVGVTLFTVPFYAGSLLWFAPLIAAIESGNLAAILAAAPFSLIGGGMFLGVPSFINYKVWHPVLAHRALAGAKLEVDRVAVQAGDELRVKLDIPNKAERVEEVVAHLVCIERARYRSGTDTMTATHERWKAPIRMVREGNRWIGRTGLPADAAASFTSKNNTIEWSVTALVKVKGMLDPTYTQILDVTAAPAPREDV